MKYFILWLSLCIGFQGPDLLAMQNSKNIDADGFQKVNNRKKNTKKKEGNIVVPRDIDFKESNIFVRAASGGRIADVNWYINNKRESIDINWLDGNGHCALSGAARFGNIGMAQLLINAGAEIDRPGLKGRTPLFFAIQNKKLDMVNFFLEKKANINSRTEEGSTPLMYAACVASAPIIEKLINCSGDKAKYVNEQSSYAIDGEPKERTALHWLLRMREGAPQKERSQNPAEDVQSCMRILVKAGANPMIKDSWDKTPCYYAAKNEWNVELDILKTSPYYTGK